MRLAFESAGCRCIFSCDWDKHARTTYKQNFGEEPLGDIRKIKSDEIPEHDILAAGFPCQPFSISGVSKKNSLGRPHGFEDKTQGTLFFEIARIIRDRRPKAFMLENVKNLLTHDNRKTIETIYETLQLDLQYHVLPPILLDAKTVVPQHRERIFIIGFSEQRSFTKPVLPKRDPKIGDILEEKVPDKYVLTDHLWSYLQKYAQKHQRAGNGFGFGMTSLNGISRTLSARYYKDGSEILIPRGKLKNPRRLTPRECARLMGFPENFIIPVSDTQAYKQFGNSVVVPVIQEIARSLVEALENKPQAEMHGYATFGRQLSLPV